MSTTNLSTNFYRKYNSFQNYILPYQRTTPDEQIKRASAVLKNADLTGAHEVYSNFGEILAKVSLAFDKGLTIKDSNLFGAANDFNISDLVAEEMATIDDERLPLYLYHRWRYEQNPKNHQLDDYPPYVQIEPSSVCNYRCKFCYQTDSSFSGKTSEYMGTMSFNDYTSIIDKLHGKVEFLSLASRGEPAICKELPSMLNYSKHKFLNLKINTNCSLMTEELAHALLDGGAKTIVFSVDAHSRELYEELRVNGKYERLIKGLTMFNNIRKEYYKRNDSIVRISGVFMDERQDMNLMDHAWKEYVDQITFVRYNPWENVYTSEKTGISEPCSDLWRRLFIWHDGSINCCDTDYKSTLLLGSCLESNLKELWHSQQYFELRSDHLGKRRENHSPCDKCSVI